MTVTGCTIAALCSLASSRLENSAMSSAAAAAEIHDASRQSFGMAEFVYGDDGNPEDAHKLGIRLAAN
jgi:hypothetical protein